MTTPRYLIGTTIVERYGGIPELPRIYRVVYMEKELTPAEVKVARDHWREERAEDRRRAILEAGEVIDAWSARQPKHYGIVEYLPDGVPIYGELVPGQRAAHVSWEGWSDSPPWYVRAWRALVGASW